MNFLQLPVCMLEEIFSYLSYDEIAKKRLVSAQINKVCHSLLNRGFNIMIKEHSKYLKQVKALLPRRESERRHHPLAKQADILTCIETRISMLSMTYSKYIDLNLCCFIPGKVIDEVFNVLRMVKEKMKMERPDVKPLRAHEVLQELRDISSMAIDHFDEKITPVLKKVYNDLNAQKVGSIYHMMPIDDAFAMQELREFSDPVDLNRQTRYEPIGAQRNVQANPSYLAFQRVDQKCKDVLAKLNQVIYVQYKQNRKIRTSHEQMADLNAQIVELRRRLEESDAKNRELTTKINQITSFNTVNPMPSTSASSCGTSGNSSVTQMTNSPKPRAATIILKRRIDEQSTDITTKQCKFSK